MTDETIMYISMAIFMGFPIAIMGAAWATDHVTKWMNRPTNDQ